MNILHSTVSQNKDHRNSIVWIKTKGNRFNVDGELYISEYTNVTTGQAIRKCWRMTGADWHTWDAQGVKGDRYNSLTVAKAYMDNGW